MIPEYAKEMSQSSEAHHPKNCLLPGSSLPSPKATSTSLFEGPFISNSRVFQLIRDNLKHLNTRDQRDISFNPDTPTSKHQQKRHSKQKDEDDHCIRFQDLPSQIKLKFGNRSPQNYQKGQLLGKGGFSLVWKAHRKGRLYAVKQIPRQQDLNLVIKEIWFGNFFFDYGQPKQQFLNHPGIAGLASFKQFRIDRCDAWLVYQLGGKALSHQLYKVYMKKRDSGLKLKYLPLYNRFREQPDLLKEFLVRLLFTLALLGQHNIVHADIKAQNILLTDGLQGIQVKLIDYGSHCLFSNLKMLNMTTPQYTAPQILNYFNYQNNERHSKQMLQLIKNYNNISAIDMFSLGLLMLEIVHGAPLWMKSVEFYSYKLKKNIVLQGALAVSSRQFTLIMSKQSQLLDRVETILTNQNHSGIRVSEELGGVIRGMLKRQPNERVSPSAALGMLKVQHQRQREKYLY